MRTLSFVQRTFFILALASALGTNCKAQDEAPSKGYIGVSLGPSIPVGQFADRSFGTTFSGFAKTGALFDISFAYTFRKSWGLSVLLRGQAHSFDSQEWANNAATTAANTGWSVTSDMWLASGYMIGGYRSNPLSDKLHLDLRAMIGLLAATAPAFTATATSGLDRGVISRTAGSASTFATLFGVGLKWDAGRKTCLLFNVDYWGGRLNFDDFTVTVTEYTGPVVTNRTSGPGEIELNLNALNIGVGFGIRL